MRPRSRYLLPFALNLVLLADEPQGMRLDGSARPVRYAVEIALRPGTDTFQGAVEIEIATRAPLDAIWMHAASLELGEISIDGKPARATPGRHQTMGFSPASGSIGAGKHILRAKYSGQVSSKSSAGVFQLQEAGRWYLYSQFQPTDARRAFPCFDEPVFKTPWTVTLVAPKEMVALANSPEVSREDAGGGMQRIRFAATRPLPSYLVAFAVGPFDMVDAGKVGRTPLRIAVPKGRSAEAAFSAQAIPQLLRLLEGYFGRPYPFTKLDSVVMPSSSFAMENPGLITYGATDLLALPESDTIKRKRMIANIAAHEVAHQWFGNLVTAAWWDDIWLNEAFASWLAEKIVGQWQPAWQAEANTALSAQRAMQTDSLASARKIRQPIVTDGDIANAFDGITYDKGSALVRMFEQWLGEDAFRSGVRRYIAKHADSSATAKDFLAAVGEAAKQDVSRQFGGFLDQSGVPEIAVALDCTRDRPRLILSTQRYLPLGSAAPPESPWMTPFCVRYESGGREFRECSVVSDPRSEMPLAKAAACPAWVLPNTEAAGYYRVRYHPALLEKLLEKGVGKLSMAEQVSFLGDVNAMVRSGALPPGPALALAPRFSGARDEVVSQVLTITGHVTGRSVPRQLKPKAARYLRSVFGERARQLGWSAKPADDDDTRLLRDRLVFVTASAGEDTVLIQEAALLANRWIDDRKSVDPDIVERVLRVAARNGGAALFDKLLALARPETGSQERALVVSALGAFRDPVILQRVFEFLLSAKLDLRETVFPLLIRPAFDPDTATIPFEFLRQNYDRLLPLLPRDVFGDYAVYLIRTGEGYCDPAGRQAVKDFFGPKVGQITGGPRMLEQTLETIGQCIAQRAHQSASIAAFLENY